MGDLPPSPTSSIGHLLLTATLPPQRLSVTPTKIFHIFPPPSTGALPQPLLVLCQSFFSSLPFYIFPHPSHVSSRFFTHCPNLLSFFVPINLSTPFDSERCVDCTTPHITAFVIPLGNFFFFSSAPFFPQFSRPLLGSQSVIVPPCQPASPPKMFFDIFQVTGPLPLHSQNGMSLSV